jgi:hypothetical protein
MREGMRKNDEAEKQHENRETIGLQHGKGFCRKSAEMNSKVRDRAEMNSKVRDKVPNTV